MFGRSRTRQQAPQAQQPAATKPGGKGRPTPSRKEAQARNARPLVGASRAAAVRPGATKQERKAARAESRRVMAEERARTRQAMLTGDERHLPARDRGPAKRWTRDFVDSRRNVGEFFIPVALAVLVLGLIRPLAVLSFILLYGMVAVVVVDVILLRRTVRRLGTAKFGAEQARALPGYATMRALQLRRARMPRTQVKRGQRPA